MKKKYINPVAKPIHLSHEAALMTTSLIGKDTDNADTESNRRDGSHNSIWGD